MANIPNKSFKVTFSDDDHIDLAMKHGHLVVSEGKNQWLQANKIGLIGQEGDWDFDPKEGLPWVDNGELPPGRRNILGNSPTASDELIKVYIYQQLSREPRNEFISNITINWKEKATRHVQASADIKSIDGELLKVEV